MSYRIGLKRYGGLGQLCQKIQKAGLALYHANAAEAAAASVIVCRCKLDIDWLCGPDVTPGVH